MPPPPRIFGLGTSNQETRPCHFSRCTAATMSLSSLVVVSLLLAASALPSAAAGATDELIASTAHRRLKGAKDTGIIQSLTRVYSDAANVKDTTKCVKPKKSKKSSEDRIRARGRALAGKGKGKGSPKEIGSVTTNSAGFAPNGLPYCAEDVDTNDAPVSGNAGGVPTSPVTPTLGSPITPNVSPPVAPTVGSPVATNVAPIPPTARSPTSTNGTPTVSVSAPVAYMPPPTAPVAPVAPNTAPTAPVAPNTGTVDAVPGTPTMQGSPTAPVAPNAAPTASNTNTPTFMYPSTSAPTYLVAYPIPGQLNPPNPSGSPPTAPAASPVAPNFGTTFTSSPADSPAGSPTSYPTYFLSSPTQYPTFIVGVPSNPGGNVAQQSVCEAFAAGTATTSAPRSDYTVGLVLHMEEGADEEAIMAQIGEILRSEIAPSLLGCTTRRSRRLQLTEVVNVVLTDPERDTEASCTQAEPDIVCVPSTIKSDLYYYGDEPQDYADELKEAILAWPFDIEGLLGIGSVSVEQTADDGRDDIDAMNQSPSVSPNANRGGVPPDAVAGVTGEQTSKSKGANAGAVVAASLAGLTLALIALFVVRRHRQRSDDSLSKHRELTDDEDFDLVMGGKGTDGSIDTDENSDSSPPRKAVIVGDEYSLESSNVISPDEVYCTNNQDYLHAPHHMCSSPNCVACEMKRQQGTQFVVADSGMDGIEHLGSERGYAADDTVSL